MSTETVQNPLHRLTPEQLDEIADEFQKIHDEVFNDLGEHDARYIHSIIELQRRLPPASRIFLMASRYPPARVLGTVGLSAAKVLENTEDAHKVLDGQWE